MNINATLFIQAFNFFIVYWMLRFFLFKPIISLIDHEKAEENALLDVIDQQQKSIAIQEKERRLRWYLCQEYFSTHKPLQTSRPLLNTDSIINEFMSIHETTPYDINAIATDVRIRLEEKIKHVH